MLTAREWANAQQKIKDQQNMGILPLLTECCLVCAIKKERNTLDLSASGFKNWLKIFPDIY